MHCLHFWFGEIIEGVDVHPSINRSGTGLYLVVLEAGLGLCCPQRLGEERVYRSAQNALQISGRQFSRELLPTILSDIRHDARNSITFAIGFAFTLASDPGLSPVLREKFETIARILSRVNIEQTFSEQAIEEYHNRAQIVIQDTSGEEEEGDDIAPTSSIKVGDDSSTVASVSPQRYSDVEIDEKGVHVSLGDEYSAIQAAFENVTPLLYQGLQDDFGLFAVCPATYREELWAPIRGVIIKRNGLQKESVSEWVDFEPRTGMLEISESLACFPPEAIAFLITSEVYRALVYYADPDNQPLRVLSVQVFAEELFISLASETRECIIAALETYPDELPSHLRHFIEIAEQLSGESRDEMRMYVIDEALR